MADRYHPRRRGRFKKVGRAVRAAVRRGQGGAQPRRPTTSKALAREVPEHYRCSGCRARAVIFRRGYLRPLGHPKHLFCFICRQVVQHRKVDPDGADPDGVDPDGAESAA